MQSAILKYLDFRDFINLICKVRNEVRLHITPDRIWCKTSDLANVMLIDFEYPRTSFEQYNLINQVICLDLEKLKPFMEMCYGFVTIIQDENKLTFRSGKYEMVMKSLDNENIKKDPIVNNLYEMSMNASVLISSSDMRKYLKGASMIADKVKFIVTNDKTVIKSLDQQDNDYVLNFVIDNGIVKDNDQWCLYSMDYINTAFKIVKGTVDFSFSDDRPCRIALNIAGNPCGYYFIAPRIETE
jgi:DNA polymerase III sliding clamp (beta) subunit (PCNA family)